MFRREEKTSVTKRAVGLAGGENGGGRALAVGVALMLAVATLAACERSSPAPIQIKRPMLNGGAAVAQARPQAGVPGDPARTVTVGAGETIYTIARRHNVSTRILIEANDLAPPYRVTPGQDLVIPGSRLHTVTDGESLYLISRAYNLDMYSLAKANKMVPPYRVYTGQQLAIPGVGVGDGKPAVEVAPVNEVLAGLEPRRGQVRIARSPQRRSRAKAGRSRPKMGRAGPRRLRVPLPSQMRCRPWRAAAGSCGRCAGG